MASWKKNAFTSPRKLRKKRFCWFIRQSFWIHWMTTRRYCDIWKPTFYVRYRRRSLGPESSSPFVTRRVARCWPQIWPGKRNASPSISAAATIMPNLTKERAFASTLISPSLFANCKSRAKSNGHSSSMSMLIREMGPFVVLPMMTRRFAFPCTRAVSIQSPKKRAIWTSH